MRRAVERLTDEWQPWGQKLARALALHTAAGLPATGRELAEGCLIYGLATESESYDLAAQLLDQMRRLAPDHIYSDDAPEPRSRLAQRPYQSIEERLRAEGQALGDAAPQLFSLLCGCGGTYFEDWPLKLLAASASDPGEGGGEEWRVDESPGVLCLTGGSDAEFPLRLIILSWARWGRPTRLHPTDFIWRLAPPTASEVEALKSFAVLREWQQRGRPDSRSPQFAQLLADYRARVDRVFMRLLILDGHLSQNARPIFIDCEPPLSLADLLLPRGMGIIVLLVADFRSWGCFEEQSNI
jgi:hypothetical protein